jgi:hypothetical protein
MDDVRKDTQKLKLPNWKILAQDRRWKELVEKAKTLHKKIVQPHKKKSVCLYPLVSSMQCACVILSSVTCSALQYVPTLSRKGHDFREKVI